MCELTDPWGPFGPVPPNSRLSSLLWQSLQMLRALDHVRQTPAEDARSQRTGRPRSILIQLVQQDAGLRQGAGSIVGHRVARRSRGSEFRNDVQRIRRGHSAPRRVPVNDQPLLARARAVAAQTILKLIDRRSKDRDAIQRADPTD